jgi:uncharacterized protein with HEPN domain
MPSDPVRRSVLALEDIRTNILLARQFCEGFTLETFQSDMRTVYAVTRCLEIVSEASRRLSPEVKSRHPHLPWIDIAGAGSVYRHDYDSVSSERLWNTVQALVPLLSVVESELAAAPPKGGDT